MQPARDEIENGGAGAGIGAAVVAATDVGRKREQNEDCHLVWIPDSVEERDRRGILLVVADGMGGAVAGEIASRLAVETVVNQYCAGTGDPLDDLKGAVEAANRAVYEKSRSAPTFNGMGTTCTAVVLRGRDAWIAHVGDSRAYLARGREMRQLTRDHTLVAQLVERNQLLPQQARTDARRNVVTRSVGVGEQVEVDVLVEGPLEPGDILLLCSDGLHGLVTDTDLSDTMSDRNLSEACQDLIALANDCGGSDNITAILARIEGSIGNFTAAYSGPERRRAPIPVYVGPERRRVHTPPPVAQSGSGRRNQLVLLVLVALALALAAWSAVWLIAGGGR